MPLRMHVGGVNLHLPWWGVIQAPRLLPPSAPSPEQMTRTSTVIELHGPQGESFPVDMNESGSEPGFLDHVDPVFGAIGFIIGVGFKFHPALKVPGLLIAAGIAVINWGSEPAGGSEVPSSGGGGGF